MRRTLLLTVTAALTLAAANVATASESPRGRSTAMAAQFHEIGGRDRHYRASRSHAERRHGGPPRHFAHGHWKHKHKGKGQRVRHHRPGPRHFGWHRPGPRHRGHGGHGVHGKFILILPFGH
jgi:hypothetical protein